MARHWARESRPNDQIVATANMFRAYRLLQPPDPVIQPHSTANSRDRTTVSFPREGEERKGVGVNATSEFKDLQAALHDVSSFILRLDLPWFLLIEVGGLLAHHLASRR